MATFTKPYHRSPYDSILPSRPELSQTGRTVLVTGSAGGIGFAIAQAFTAASARRIIILARRLDALEAAKFKLETTVITGSNTEILVERCDIADSVAVEKMWDALSQRGISVDVMVLNAVDATPVTSLTTPGAVKTTEAVFRTNVFGNLRMTERFFAQGTDSGKVILNISSVSAHWHPQLPGQALYGASKASFAVLFQNIADEAPPEKVQMCSIHPGAIFTPGAANAGFSEDSIPWDSEDLPAFYSVWAASKEAAFLHGRFVWAHWDVGELKKMEQQIKKDAGFLKLGLQGVEHVNPGTIWDQIKRASES